MSDSKARSRQRYTQFAEGYVTSKTHASGTDLARLLDIARPRSDWRVLDVATGGGHTALLFAPHVARVTASDLTGRMLRKAAEHIRAQGAVNVDFCQTDAEALPFAPGSYDLVTCRIAPHHFPDAGLFVREAARVLRPGGLLLVQDHVLPDDPDAAQYVDGFEKRRDPSHNHAFTQAGWITLFQKAGLSVQHTEQITKRHDFIPWAERQGCSPDVIADLSRRLVNAPPLAAAWLDVEQVGTPAATFINHHLLIAGRK